MNVRNKALILLISVMSLTLFAVILISRIIILKSFTNLEKQDVYCDINKIQSNFELQLDKFSGTSADWGNWDETYTFAKGHNYDYIKTNLSNEALSNIGINFLMIINRSNQVLAQRCISLPDANTIELPVALSEFLQQYKPYNKPDKFDIAFNGIAFISDSIPVYIAANPVLQSNQQGPSAGVIIIGRFIDNKEMESLYKLTQSEFTFIPTSKYDLNSKFHSYYSNISIENFLINYESTSLLYAYTLLNVINSTSPVLIELKHHRDIYLQGREAVAKMLLILVLTWIVFTILIIYFMNKVIVKPVFTISNEVIDIGNSNNFSKRITVKSNDELGQLASSVNLMISNLELSYKNLRKSQIQYHDLFDGMLSGVILIEIITDHSGKLEDFLIKDINPASERLLNFHRSDIIRKKVRDIFTPDEDAWLHRYAQTVFRENKMHIEDYIACVDKYFEIIAYSTNQKFIAIIFQDISDRIKAEKLLSKEKEHISLILQNIDDAVINTDTDGHVIYLNTAAENIIGNKLTNVIGSHINKLFTIKDARTMQEVENPINRVTKTIQAVTLEQDILLVTRNGQDKHIQCIATPIIENDNNFTGALLTLRDITEKRQLENELYKIRHIESLGVLASGIAHDFNNLLSGIFGYIELAKTNINNGKKASGYLVKAEKAYMRAGDLAGKLITFAKGGAPNKKRTVINQLLKDTATINFAGSNIKSEFIFDKDIWMCEVDTGQFSEALTNLMINAKQSMPKGGTVKFCTENLVLEKQSGIPLDKGLYIKILISDSATGIESSVADQLLDPYFATKEDNQGFGLSIAFTIIQRHSGYLTVNANPIEGNSFTIYLPAIKSEPSENSDIPVEIHRGKGTILLMDDEEYMLDMVSTMLEESGYKVFPCQNGNEALTIYNKSIEENIEFNGAILDLTIRGGLSGKDTAEQLLKINPDLPIIAYSGYSVDPIIASPTQYGFKAALKKPFTFIELREYVNSYFAEI
jgi:PAS domain S-box-containing protein